MTIEFRCIRCGQRLRVPGEDRGKRARCPTCNAIVDIPGEENTASPIVLSREKSDVIDYELFGDESQYVEITLDPGEVTAARMENLLYLSPGIAMENAVTSDSDPGGLLEKISAVGRRILTGSSLRMTAFCNVAEQREIVAFAPSKSSRLIPMHLEEYGNRVICHGDAILCAARGIEISDTNVPVVSDVIAMHQLTGDGIVVLQAIGQVAHRQLKAGKVLAVTMQNIIAMTSDLEVSAYESLSIEDQAALAILRGPGEIWLQTGV